MNTETFTHVAGRRVVASDDAETIGAVNGFVMDPAGRRIEAIHVDGHGKRATILAWSSVTAFGTDAVMASSSADPSTIDNEHQMATIKGSVTMIGARILNVEGLDVGVVADVEFDTDAGAVTRVLTEQGSIESARLRALGSYALVVDCSAASTSGDQR